MNDASAGRIPTEIGQLAQLTDLHLWRNKLTGAHARVTSFIVGKVTISSQETSQDQERARTRAATLILRVFVRFHRGHAPTD